MKLFQTIAYSLQITLVACIVNGFICGLYATFGAMEASGAGVLLLTILCSALFSIPVLLIFVLCFYMWGRHGKKGQPLFRALVILAAFIALCTSLLFYRIFWRVIPLPLAVVAITAVMASISSVFLYRGVLISLFQSDKKPSHV